MPSTVTTRLLSGNDINLYTSEQSAKGAINTSPVFVPTRRLDGAGKTTTSYIQSKIVKGNRQARPNIRDRNEYGLSMSGELDKQGIRFLCSAIHSPNVTSVTTTDTGFAAVSGGFTSSADFGSVSVGDYIWFTGFAASALNRCYRVATKASSSAITTYPAPTTTESAGATVTLTMRKFTSGSTQTYYAVQTRAFDDSKTSDTDFHTLYDAIIDSFSLDIPDTGIASYKLEMLAESKVAGTATISGQTDAAAYTDDPVSAAVNIADFEVAGVTQINEVKSMSIEVKNNYSKDAAAGSQGMRTAYGDIDVSGKIAVRSMTASPFTWRDYYEAGTEVSLAVRIAHTGGGETVLIIRTAKITDWSMANGSNAIANSECSFMAEEDATTATTIEVFTNWS
jgi:hypothetical protein